MVAYGGGRVEAAGRAEAGEPWFVDALAFDEIAVGEGGGRVEEVKGSVCGGLEN